MTAGTSTERPAALAISGLDAGYGSVKVIRGAELVVEPAQVVALLGANGAGKTTLLRTASGSLSPSAGSIRIAGEDVTRMRPTERARRGLCLIPEGRGIFRSLSVEENLLLSSPPWIKSPKLNAAYDAFPLLFERRKQTAGSMSGGQQQMLALSRGFLSGASVVLVDEVSMGLAPVMVDVIFEALQSLVARGKSLLLVEQYVQRALAMADVVYVMKKGIVTRAGASGSVDEAALMADYLG
jgi:branched-chain amino acid transport system ATP-binding protein